MTKIDADHNWLDDAFDDKKTQAELERAQGKGLGSLGCAIAGVLVVVIVAGLIIMGLQLFDMLSKLQ